MDSNGTIYSDPLRAGDGGSIISNYNRSREYTSYDYDQKIRDSFVNIVDDSDNDSFSSYHEAICHSDESDDNDSSTSSNTMICHSTTTEDSDAQSIASYDTMVCHSSTTQECDAQSIASYDTMVCHSSTGDDQSIVSCGTMVCHSSSSSDECDKESLVSFNSIAIINTVYGNNSEEESCVNYDAAVSLNTTLDDEDGFTHLDDTIELNHLKPIKQVCFSDTDFEIEPSITWSKEELIAGREGPWVDIAFANYEFKCRIEEEFEELISPVLKKAQIKIMNSRRALEDQQNRGMESILV